jgi:hypothetical protein
MFLIRIIRHLIQRDRRQCVPSNDLIATLEGDGSNGGLEI